MFTSLLANNYAYRDSLVMRALRLSHTKLWAQYFASANVTLSIHMYSLSLSKISLILVKENLVGETGTYLY